MSKLLINAKANIEPMLFARVGSKNLKAVFRLGFNFAFTKSNKEFAILNGFEEYDGTLDYTILHISVGISYRITGKK